MRRNGLSSRTGWLGVVIALVAITSIVGLSGCTVAKVTKSAEELAKARPIGDPITHPEDSSDGGSEWREIASFSGQGQTETSTFLVAGDRFRVVWTHQGGLGSLFNLKAFRPGDDLSTEFVATQANDSGEGTTIVNQTGEWYFLVDAANSNWTIRVEVEK